MQAPKGVGWLFFLYPKVEWSGALKTREWKTPEWTSRHEEAGVDNAGVENAGVAIYFDATFKVLLTIYYQLFTSSSSSSSS